MAGISQVICSKNIGGSDIQFNSSNDILTVDGDELTQQRILRRLMTTPGTYLQHPTYGVGLPIYIGLPLTDELFSQLKTLVINQMFLEDGVSKAPEPVIELTSLTRQLFIQITYVPVGKDIPVVLSYTFQK